MGIEQQEIRISFVVPVFNEEDNVKILYRELIERIRKYKYQIIFVDDGSTDETLSVVAGLAKSDCNVHYVSFSRNFGHQAALRAGLNFADGDCVIFMDGDMQHPPSLVPDMIAKWMEGWEIVYTIRNDRGTTPYVKRKMSQLFYTVFNVISGLHLNGGAADFRLIDKKVAEVMKVLPEKRIFFRGLIPWLGFTQYGMKYEPSERHSGTSKYGLRKMIGLACDGLFSFSLSPLRVPIALGTIVFLVGCLLSIYVVLGRYFLSRAISGWDAVIAALLVMGGIHLISVGIVGMYIGNIWIESQNRPPYVIRQISKGIVRNGNV